MAFEELDALGLRDFIIRERSLKSFWYFMHIPKTAGSSFSEAMQTSLSPYRNIQIDYSDDSLSHNEKISISVDNFLRDYKEDRFCSASGHTPFDLVEKIKSEIPETSVVTFLREPISRVVSDYRYQRTPQHPPYQDFIARFPTIDDYINSVESQNKVSRFVAGRGAKFELDKLIDRIDREFSFVGTLEMYPLSYNLIFNIFGIPGQFPKIHARKTPDTEDTKVVIDGKIKEKILETNEFDVGIYSHVSKRLARAKETWADYINSGFPSEWS